LRQYDGGTGEPGDRVGAHGSAGHVPAPAQKWQETL